MVNDRVWFQNSLALYYAGLPQTPFLYGGSELNERLGIAVSDQTYRPGKVGQKGSPLQAGFFLSAIFLFSFSSR
jgi:hypothetical protein